MKTYEELRRDAYNRQGFTSSWMDPGRQEWAYSCIHERIVIGEPRGIFFCLDCSILSINKDIGCDSIPRSIFVVSPFEFGSHIMRDGSGMCLPHQLPEWLNDRLPL